MTLGGPLTVTTGGILFDNSTGSATISSTNPAFTLGATNANMFITVGGTTPTNTLNISAPITSGTGGLTKGGTGTLVISGANNYTGNTTIDEGTIQLSGSSASLGAITTAANVTTIRQGATLDLNGAGPNGVVTIGGLSGAGTVTNSQRLHVER